MNMRIKATESLARLKKMKTKKRKSVVFNEIHTTEWHKHDTPGGLQKYIKLMSWCNRNVTKHYSRGEGAFWFEDEKDAFKFALRWGNSDGEQ